jgi:uncharacterized membrane protein YwaF
LRGFFSLEADPGTWDSFAPYGGLHFAAVSVCALLVAGLVVTARALAAPQEAALRRGFGVFAVAYWIAYNIWWNRHELNPATGLPLHLCDLNGFVAPLALLTGRRWLRATLYFWTFALTLQAFIQPTLTHGPASPCSGSSGPRTRSSLPRRSTTSPYSASAPNGATLDAPMP